MDRMAGGRRIMLIGSCVGRAVVAVLMISSAGSDSLVLFPEAFVMLVLAKSYTVAKAAIVPTVVVGDHALVEANSKLQLLSGIAAFGAGLPGALVLWLFWPGAVAFVCAVVFVVAIVASLRVPVTTVAAEPEDAEERAELRSAGVLSAASAMGTLRWIVGFVTLPAGVRAPRRGAGGGPRGDHRSRARRAGCAGGSGRRRAVDRAAGVALRCGRRARRASADSSAPAIAPMVRRRIEEEYLLLGAVVLAAPGRAVPDCCSHGLPGQALLAFGVAVAAASGKQAFDAVVQRDAPDANRGRSFARFESALPGDLGARRRGAGA